MYTGYVLQFQSCGLCFIIPFTYFTIVCARVFMAPFDVPYSMSNRSTVNKKSTWCHNCLEASLGLKINAAIKAIMSLLSRKFRRYWCRVQDTVFSSTIANFWPVQVLGPAAVGDIDIWTSFDYHSGHKIVRIRLLRAGKLIRVLTQCYNSTLSLLLQPTLYIPLKYQMALRNKTMEGYNIVTLLYSILRCMLVTTHTTFVGTQETVNCICISHDSHTK